MRTPPCTTIPEEYATIGKNIRSVEDLEMIHTANYRTVF